EPQQLRPSVPLYHLGRKPRTRAGRRRGRLPAGRAAIRRGDPALARPPPPRPKPEHDPAAGARRRANPVGRLRRRDDGHLHQPPDREHRPAVEGLRRHRPDLPARPRRPDLPPEVRRPRLPGRRAILRAGNGGAGRRRGHRAADAGHARARPAHQGLHGPDGREAHRPHTLRPVRGGAERLLVPRPRRRAGVGGVPGLAPQGRPQLGGRHDRGRGLGRARGPRRAGLWQARLRPRECDDVDQRRQGRGDRRRHGRGRPHGPRERRRDLLGRGEGAVLRLQQGGRHPGRHLHGTGDRGPVRGEAHLLHPVAPAVDPPRRHPRRGRHQGPPRSLRGHPRGPRGRGHDGARACRPPASGPWPDRRDARADRQL
ncbi:MAG: Chorismate synthase, partial [uncultured Rubellimicrobium sp.]